MSFFRHPEIFPSDRGATLSGCALAHRLDEFPAGYSSAGCSPAEPASASPTGHDFAVRVLRRTMIFQPTACCRLTGCLSRGMRNEGMLAALWILLTAGLNAQATPPGLGEKKINPKDGLTYIWIPPATFQMGCLGAVIPRPTGPGIEDCLGNELPRHFVRLSKGYWIGQTLVTQQAYRRVIGDNPSTFQGDQLPVDSVSWVDAKIYC